MHALLPPELVKEIASYLNHHDILHAVTVNKLWNSVWTPFLWANFTVVGGSALTKADVDRLVEIIGRSRQLRVLNVINMPVPSAWFERLLVAIAPRLARLKKLRLMHMHVHPKATPLAMRTFLETCSPDLEILSLKFGLSCPVGQYGAPPSTSIEGTKAHPKLKVLELQIGYPSSSGVMEPVFPWMFNTFLEGCTGLEIADDRIPAFEGYRLWATDDASVTKILRQNMGTHFERCLSLPLANSNESIAHALLSSTDVDSGGIKKVWQAINLGQYPMDGITEADSKAIVHAASQRGTQRLKVNGEDWLKGEELLTILRECPTLRVHDCGYERYPTVSAYDMILKPWSCKWLKSLHLIIAGIPRPDVTIDCMNKPIPAGDPLHSGSMDESRVLQRQVCAQLGALVCLEELCLGYSRLRDVVTEEIIDDDGSQIVQKYNPFLQLTCLELTLESGLDLMSELKSLETFSVWGMDHRIGKKELHWMQRHWHSVRTVNGLLPLPYQESKRHFGSDPSIKFCKVPFSIM
ncbi:hypothetical protein EC991_002146 [Linnemannia zychae]|nr:hypothetical protein EC991_002146 [Linnemannia zychae]